MLRLDRLLSVGELLSASVAGTLLLAVGAALALVGASYAGYLAALAASSPPPDPAAAAAGSPVAGPAVVVLAGVVVAAVGLQLVYWG